ncbi:AAA family ATPase [Marine Group I thaumarchaeote]|uniref:AAA family ATPase n=1 Tax=Marine Group I thaumarchaeote TaxID=2511932 RepID=A0A7K4MW68_9ARCH|nr:AAA family ATPase [Marine Group I thaumarchaeote]
MIYFKDIRWKNLLSTGNQFTEVQLNKSSTTLIVGENGSGKSTVLDALCFGLFNKPFRRINRPQLVNSINDGGLLVEIEFDYGSKSYKVRRGIKKNIFEIYVDGKRLNQDAKVTDQQEYLEKTILKLNYKSFTQIVLLGTAGFVPFMQLKSIDRRAIIEDLLDIQIFSVMNVLLKNKISENKEDSQNIEVNRKLSVAHISNTEEAINDLKKTKTNQIQQNESDINTNEEEVDRLNTTVKKLMDEISKDKTAQSLEEWRGFQNGIERKMLASEGEIEFYEKNDICLTCNQELNEEHKHKMIEEHHGLLHESGGALLRLGNKIEDLQTRLDYVSKVQTAITTNQNQIQAISSYITKLKDQIKEIEAREDDIEDKIRRLRNLKGDLKNCMEKQEKLSAQKQLFETAYVLLKDTGIKTRIIKQYLPIMNTLINKYLASLDFFVSFNLDEKFEEKIKSRHRDEFTYDSFSEGEKMRIDLALLFTWRTIAKMKNSVNTNLLILDEVFDSSLDANGTEEFLKIINQLAGKQNTFIISHKGDVLFDKFKNVIKFEKYKNFSRIV